MYLISHHLFKSNKFLRECPWTENFPVDQLVDEDNTVWNLLSTDYYWSKDASADKVQTLDGNWEDQTQIDKTETDLGSNFKYSWAGIESTWDSLT